MSDVRYFTTLLRYFYVLYALSAVLVKGLLLEALPGRFSRKAPGGASCYPHAVLLDPGRHRPERTILGKKTRKGSKSDEKDANLRVFRLKYHPFGTFLRFCQKVGKVALPAR